MECMVDSHGTYIVLIRSDEKPKLEGLGLNGIIILKGSARRGVTPWTVLIVVVKF